MNKEEAISIASDFLKQKNLENMHKEKFKWVLTEPIEIETAWYFDFKFELINKEEGIDVGGNPGFKIIKENQIVENLSWEDYNSIILK